MPLPRREVAQLRRQPLAPDLPLLRLRRARQRGRLPDGARRPGLRRGGQGSGRRARPDRARRRPRPARARARRPGPGEAALAGGRARQGLPPLPRPAQGQPPRDRLSEGPRPDRRDRRALRPGLCAGGLARPGQRLRRIRRPQAGRVRPGHPAGRGRRAAPLRPLPRPDHVPDPQPQGRGHRLRRAGAGQGRAEIPELARDAGLPEGPRALRPVRGARGDPPARLHPDHRRLHGRGRAGAARRGQRGGDAGHRLHRRPCGQAAALRRAPGLQLRRRRGRAAGGSARDGGGAAACRRHPQLPIPLPAGRARSGHLHPRARHRGLRAVHRRGGAAVAPAARHRRRGLRPDDAGGSHPHARAGAAAVRADSRGPAEDAAARRAGARRRRLVRGAGAALERCRPPRPRPGPRGRRADGTSPGARPRPRRDRSRARTAAALGRHSARRPRAAGRVRRAGSARLRPARRRHAGTPALRARPRPPLPA